MKYLRPVTEKEMSWLIKLEETASFGLALYLFSFLRTGTWVFWMFLLSPDLSMLGYLINPKIGAVLYNFFHHKALGILCYVGGTIAGHEILQVSGLILFAHASMDRIFGYGLKYTDSFSHTHLGYIGKNKNNE
jgi:hypothetical protein